MARCFNNNTYTLDYFDTLFKEVFGEGATFIITRKEHDEKLTLQDHQSNSNVREKANYTRPLWQAHQAVQFPFGN